MKTRPLPPLQDALPSMQDSATDGYSLAALEQLVSDCKLQPDWRTRADRAHAYYDIGKQLTPERERKIRVEMGIDPVQINLIHGVINGVLGQEARARSDVVIEADDDDFQDVADVLSKSMKEATREANSDMAVSNGYAGQMKGGIGWVEVSRAMDPLDYPYRVTDIHRREIWYDWRSKHLGLNDARWLVRVRWQDLDEAVAMMPEHRKVLENAVNGWNILELPQDTNSYLYSAWTNERRTSIVRDEWVDSARKRIKLFEVWYRVPAETVVLHTGPGKRIAYDENNPLHVEAVSRGAVKISKVTTRQVRMALFAGPHRLLDVPTTRRSFPYVPFFCFRDDEDNSPYGLIEGMIAPQDGYNERRQWVDWMLRARQVTIDNDALSLGHNNFEDIARSVNKPDMVAILNANRRNANAFKIGNDLAIQREQFEVMQDNKQLIQEVPRVYSTQLGDAPSGVTSGVAINSLTEAGAVAMGEANDNYRFARRLVHEQLLDLIIEDHAAEDLRVILGSGQSKRVIVLNTWDPQTGAPVNRVKDAPIKVGLSDIPNSPAFRMQEQQQIATIIQALQNDPAALNILAPAYIESSSLNNRQQIADDLRRATGVPVASDRQQQQAAVQQQQQEMARRQQIEAQKAAAEVAEKQSQATLNMARAHQISHDIASDLTAMDQPDESQLIREALAEAAQGRQQPGRPTP